MPSPECEKLIGKLRNYRDSHDLSIEEDRVQLDELSKRFALPEGIATEAFTIDNIPAEWIIPKDARGNGVIYYLHGGGYFNGSIQAYRHVVSTLAEATGHKALLIEYRLAPEHPFPAGLDDAIAVYRWLLDEGHPAESIAIAGDSAGGGLSLATMLRLRDEDGPLPKCAVLISPWTDLKNAVASRGTRSDVEPVLSSSGAEDRALRYAGDPSNLEHPYVSPIYADLTELPPTLIQVGTEEILLDDSTIIADRMRDAGVDVSLDIWDGLFHVWHYYVGWLPEAEEAIDEVGAFISGYLG